MNRWYTLHANRIGCDENCLNKFNECMTFTWMIKIGIDNNNKYRTADKIRSDNIGQENIPLGNVLCDAADTKKNDQIAIDVQSTPPRSSPLSISSYFCFFSFFCYAGDAISIITMMIASSWRHIDRLTICDFLVHGVFIVKAKTKQQTNHKRDEYKVRRSSATYSNIHIFTSY